MAYATALTILADPTRRKVFERLRAGPRPVNALAAGLPVSRPAVSQHLKALKDAGPQESPHFLMGLNFAEFSINFMRMPNHMLTNGWNEASDQAR